MRWKIIISEAAFGLALIVAMALALMGCGGQASSSSPTPKVEDGSYVKLLSQRGKDYQVEFRVPPGRSVKAVILKYAGPVGEDRYADNCTPIWCPETRAGHTWGGFPKGKEYWIQDGGGDPIGEGTYRFDVFFLGEWAPDLMGWELVYNKEGN